MEAYEKLEKLQNEYLKLHPNSEAPQILMFTYSVDDVIELLEKANGREIVYVDEVDKLDGGYYEYID
jgi:hypothetical protein